MKITNFWILKDTDELDNYDDANNVRFEVSHPASQVQFEKVKFNPETDVDFEKEIVFFRVALYPIKDNILHKIHQTA